MKAEEAEKLRKHWKRKGSGVGLNPTRAIQCSVTSPSEQVLDVGMGRRTRPP